MSWWNSWGKEVFGFLGGVGSTIADVEKSRYQSRAAEYAFLSKRQEAYNMQQAQNNNSLFLWLGVGSVFLVFLILILVLIFNRK